MSRCPFRIKEQADSDKHSSVQGRRMCAVARITKREGCYTLGTEKLTKPRETRRKHRLLAKKHHFNKWSLEVRFFEELGEEILKNMSNECTIIGFE